MTTELNIALSTPIESENEAKCYLFQLDQMGVSYHPEDPAASIVECLTGANVFTDEQAVLADLRMEEVYQYLDDPCAYILDHVNPMATDESREFGVFA